MIELPVTLTSTGGAVSFASPVPLGYTKNKGVYRLLVTAEGEWEGLTIRCFWHLPGGTDPASSLVQDGFVDVPASVTAHPGNGCITFEGSDGVKTVTSADLRYRVGSNSGTEDGTMPEPGTPAWEQLVSETAVAVEAVQKQIGNLDDLTTKAKETLVAAINEAARTGSGVAGSITMRTDGGYIQYSTDDGSTWENLIALAELKGEPGQNGADGAPGQNGADGAPGADGYSPTASVEQIADGAKITITDKSGTTEAQVLNGKDGRDGTDGAPGRDGVDGQPGKDGTDGITPTIGDNGNWYLGATDTGKPSRGATGDAGPTGPQGTQGEQGPRGPQGEAGPQGPAGKDGAGMDITGATVGQIAKISAVDENGKPTAWVPVDMPTGGEDGGSAAGWTLLCDKTITVEDATVIEENLLQSSENMVEFLGRFAWTKNASTQSGNDSMSFTCGHGVIDYGRFCDPTNSNGEILFQIDVAGNDRCIFTVAQGGNGLLYNTAPVRSGYSHFAKPARFTIARVGTFAAPYTGTIELLLWGR